MVMGQMELASLFIYLHNIQTQAFFFFSSIVWLYLETTAMTMYYTNMSL